MFMLPTSKSKDDDFYSFSQELDGIDYVFTFYWNERATAWFMSVALTDGTELLSGNKITTGTNLFEWWVDQVNTFRGVLLVRDSSGTDADPGRYDLAPDGRCTIFYLEQVDLRALRGDTDDEALAALAAMGLTAADIADAS
mgnify:FL=1